MLFLQIVPSCDCVGSCGAVSSMEREQNRYYRAHDALHLFNDDTSTAVNALFNGHKAMMKEESS